MPLTKIQSLGITDGTIVNADINASAAIAGTKLSGAGKVLQVVQATHATEVTTSSTSYVTTNLTASITPSSASNKILIIVAFPGDNSTGNGGNEGGDFTIFRGASTDLLTRGGDTYYNSGGVNIGMSVSMNYLDSPATTSSTSYTVYMKARDATSSMKSCHNGSTGTIILMEIAA